MEQHHRRARISGWTGVAGVLIAMGATEFLAGISDAVPSAISSVGSYVIDISPAWLKTFAISTFGTADKAVLAIGIVVVSVIIGWFLGKASVDTPIPIVLGFGVAGVVGVLAQLGQPGVSGLLAAASTMMAVLLGLATWFGLRAWAGGPTREITDEDVPDISRRRLVVGLAGAAIVTAVAINVGRGRIRGRADAQRGALILPDPVEIQLDPTSANDFDLGGVPPIVVGNVTFYRIDTALVIPTVDADDWTLTIKGMVDNEVTLTYDQLASMPLVERYVTLACVSNEVGDNLVGNALWTGVLLRDLLEVAGVQPGAEQVVGRSVDGFTAGFPVAAALDDRDALVAIGMNREVLPANHGFPARLVVPGLYGYVSATKWLTEIELTTWESFDGYWVPRGWSKKAPIKTQSRIDRPRHRANVDAGSYTFGGVAWAPTRGIELVEVRIDGEPWRPAEISEPLSENAWVQWKLDSDLSAGKHVVSVRATDGSGFTQTEADVSPRPDGAEGWHTIEVTAEEV